MTLKELFYRETLWYKKATVIETLHCLRSLQKLDWTEKDTAKELGISISHVSEDLKLAKIVKLDESIKNLSRNSALKRIRNNDR